MVFSVNPPTIQGLGMSSGLEMQLLDINSRGPAEMSKAIAALQHAASGSKEIASISSASRSARTETGSRKRSENLSAKISIRRGWKNFAKTTT